MRGSRTREAGNRDAVEGVVADTPKLSRNRAVGFIDWLGRVGFVRRRVRKMIFWSTEEQNNTKKNVGDRNERRENPPTAHTGVPQSRQAYEEDLIDRQRCETQEWHQVFEWRTRCHDKSKREIGCEQPQEIRDPVKPARENELDQRAHGAKT